MAHMRNNKLGLYNNGNSHIITQSIMVRSLHTYMMHGAQVYHSHYAHHSITYAFHVMVISIQKFTIKIIKICIITKITKRLWKFNNTALAFSDA